MPSRRAVAAFIESSYGTTKSTPTLNTDYFFLRLNQQVAFEAEFNPQRQDISYGGGRVTAATEYADVALAPFKLSTFLYPGLHSSLMLHWCTTLINSGRTTPWTTTDSGSVMPAGDLASMTFYRMFQNPDGTYAREKWLGCKAHDWSLSFAEGATGRPLVLSVSGMGIKCVPNSFISGDTTAPTDTEFPDPAETDYPTGPWLFSHLVGSTGTVKIASARTQIASLKISGKNTMSPRTYEQKVLVMDRFHGREVTADIELRYKPSPTDIISWQARTVLDSEFKLDNGTNTLKLDMNGQNRFTSFERSEPDGDEYGRKMTLKNFYDPAVSGDLVVTYT
jgi:hypothetical protein